MKDVFFDEYEDGINRGRICNVLQNLLNRFSVEPVAPLPVAPVMPPQPVAPVAPASVQKTQKSTSLKMMGKDIGNFNEWEQGERRLSNHSDIIKSVQHSDQSNERTIVGTEYAYF